MRAGSALLISFLCFASICSLDVDQIVEEQNGVDEGTEFDVSEFSQPIETGRPLQTTATKLRVVDAAKRIQGVGKLVKAIRVQSKAYQKRKAFYADVKKGKGHKDSKISFKMSRIDKIKKFVMRKLMKKGLKWPKGVMNNLKKFVSLKVANKKAEAHYDMISTNLRKAQTKLIMKGMLKQRRIASWGLRTRLKMLHIMRKLKTSHAMSSRRKMKSIALMSRKIAKTKKKYAARLGKVKQWFKTKMRKLEIVQAKARAAYERKVMMNNARFGGMRLNKRAKKVLINIAVKVTEKNAKASVKKFAKRDARSRRKMAKAYAISDKWFFTKAMAKYKQLHAVAGRPARKLKTVQARADRYFEVLKSAAKERQIKAKTADSFAKRKLAQATGSAVKALKQELKAAVSKHCPCNKKRCQCRDRKNSTCRTISPTAGRWMSSDFIHCTHHEPPEKASLAAAQFDKLVHFPKLKFKVPKFHMPSSPKD